MLIIPTILINLSLFVSCVPVKSKNPLVSAAWYVMRLGAGSWIGKNQNQAKKSRKYCSPKNDTIKILLAETCYCGGNFAMISSIFSKAIIIAPDLIEKKITDTLYCYIIAVKCKSSGKKEVCFFSSQNFSLSPGGASMILLVGKSKHLLISSKLT